MKVHVNPLIEKTIRVFPSQGRYGKLRYDMNENLEGLPKELVEFSEYCSHTQTRNLSI